MFLQVLCHFAKVIARTALSEEAHFGECCAVEGVVVGAGLGSRLRWLLV